MARRSKSYRFEKRAKELKRQKKKREKLERKQKKGTHRDQAPNGATDSVEKEEAEEEPGTEPTTEA